MRDPKARADHKLAQAVTTLVINDREHERLRFEVEDDAEDDMCGHCDVVDGSFHLLGCEMERCPRCHRQMISCACTFAPLPGEPPLKWRTR